MRRTGERGAGQFEEITWDEAIKTLADKLREIQSERETYKVAFAAKSSRGVTAIAAEIFASAFVPRGLRMHLVSESPNRNVESDGDIYNRFVEPIFDIANATYLISFGARFLETWQSPVRYSLAYGEFRNAKGKPRGKFVHVEPRMSLTAANADEWLPARIGTEGLVALAIAQVIIREGLRKDAPRPEFLSEPLDDYAPEKIADRADIPAEKIIRIAREFASSERPLAIGTARSVAHGRENMTAISYLNLLVGNVGKPGGVVLPAVDDFDPLDHVSGEHRIASLQEDLLSKEGIGDVFSALLVHQSNPVYKTPRGAEGIRKIPFIASFSPFMDETTALADLILPDHTYLESWDISATLVDEKRVAVTVNRPVVKPELNTRQTADVLIAISREIGGADFSPAFESAEEMVRKAIEQLPLKGEETADSIIEKGVWTGEATGKAQPYDLKPFRFSLLSTSAEANDDYPLTLLAYEHPVLGAGEHSNIPMLQELPDPMTSVMWGSWVEINPKTAATLGIREGDLVAVTSPHGTIRAPAVLYPAIRPDTVAFAYGQGHTVGRYAKDRGANAALINPFAINPGTTEEIVRVNITKVAGDARLIRFGTMLPEHPEVKR
jgi:anaerobic selenocysteine-containing dehydrogenase